MVVFGCLYRIADGLSRRPLFTRPDGPNRSGKGRAGTPGRRAGEAVDRLGGQCGGRAPDQVGEEAPDVGGHGVGPVGRAEAEGRRQPFVDHERQGGPCHQPRAEGPQAAVAPQQAVNRAPRRAEAVVDRLGRRLEPPLVERMAQALGDPPGRGVRRGRAGLTRSSRRLTPSGVARRSGPCARSVAFVAASPAARPTAESTSSARPLWPMADLPGR